jgi:hypothetical protein
MVTTTVNYLDQVDANNGNPLQCSIVMESQGKLCGHGKVMEKNYCGQRKSWKSSGILWEPYSNITV